jgi:hypothetical protein
MPYHRNRSTDVTLQCALVAGCLTLVALSYWGVAYLTWAMMQPPGR